MGGCVDFPVDSCWNFQWVCDEFLRFPASFQLVSSWVGESFQWIWESFQRNSTACWLKALKLRFSFTVTSINTETIFWSHIFFNNFWINQSISIILFVTCKSFNYVQISRKKLTHSKEIFEKIIQFEFFTSSINMETIRVLTFSHENI
jgi:hypothetical protein